MGPAVSTQSVTILDLDSIPARAISGTALQQAMERPAQLQLTSVLLTMADVGPIQSAHRQVREQRPARAIQDSIRRLRTDQFALPV